MLSAIISKIRALLGLDRGEPARYAVRRSPPETGGWVKLDTGAFEDLDEPVDAEAFRFEHEANDGELEPGTYRLWRIEDNLLRSVPEEIGWSLKIEGTDDPADVDGLPEVATEERTVDDELQRLANEALAEALEEGWLPADLEEELITGAFGAGSLDRSELLQKLMLDRPLVGLLVAIYLDPERGGRMIGALIGGVLEGATAEN